MKWIREHKVISCIIAALVIAAGVFAFFASGDRSAGPAVPAAGQKVTEGSEGVKGFFKGIFGYGALKEENEALEAENEELKKELAETRLSRDELEELRGLSDALDYKAVKKGDIAAGNIVSLDRSVWLENMTLDIGTADGVEKDDTVVSGNGLVGKIASCGKHWSKVLTITEDDSNTGFRVSGKKNTLGMLAGDGRGGLSGYAFDPSADIEKGDRVVSSGIGLYPAGIDIGVVTEAEYNKGTQLLTVKVEPAVDMRELTKAGVIR